MRSANPERSAVSQYPRASCGMAVESAGLRVLCMLTRQQTERHGCLADDPARAQSALYGTSWL